VSGKLLEGRRTSKRGRLCRPHPRERGCLW